jgi:hypothetical protein
MRWVKRERIRAKRQGIDLDAQLNAVIAVNSGRDGQVTHVQSDSHATSQQGGGSGQRASTREAADEDRRGGGEGK